MILKDHRWARRIVAIAVFVVGVPAVLYLLPWLQRQRLNQISDAESQRLQVGPAGITQPLGDGLVVDEFGVVWRGNTRVGMWGVESGLGISTGGEVRVNEGSVSPAQK